jgi:hypothetical protein
MTNSDAQRLRLLEKDNRELKQMFADLLLEKRVLKVVLEKNSKPAGPAGAAAGGPREDDVLGAACLHDPRAAPQHGTLPRQAPPGDAGGGGCLVGGIPPPASPGAS